MAVPKSLPSDPLSLYLGPPLEAELLYCDERLQS